MKGNNLDGILSSFKRASLHNSKRTGNKEPYQVIKENIYEMARLRKMRLDELMFAVYLRGKSCRYGNPFKLNNSAIYYELATTREIVDKIKARLQLKGVIKYAAGTGKAWTEYTMIDSVLIHKNRGESYPQVIHRVCEMTQGVCVKRHRGYVSNDTPL